VFTLGFFEQQNINDTDSMRHYEMFVFLFVSSALPWAGCLLVGGAPAKWRQLFQYITSKLMLFGSAAYGLLLCTLSFILFMLIGLVADNWYTMSGIPAIVVSLRVAIPITTECVTRISYRCRKRLEHLDI